MISGVTAGNDRARDRLQGCGRALTARGTTRARARVEKPYSSRAGREGLRALMAAARPHRGDVRQRCPRDRRDRGVQYARHRRAARVSITGFDDMEIASLVSPGLTTVHFPTLELGQLAAANLLAQLAGTAPRASTNCRSNSKCAGRPRRRPARSCGARAKAVPE